jgi:hypothetical protein
MVDRRMIGVKWLAYSFSVLLIRCKKNAPKGAKLYKLFAYSREYAEKIREGY